MSIQQIFATALLILLQLSFGFAGNFPKELDRCRRDDPNLNECLKDAIQRAQPYLAQGIKSLRFPPIEPLITPTLQFHQNFGPVKLDVDFKNVSTHGYSKVQLSKVIADVDNYEIKLAGLFPKIYITGEYGMRGNLFILPINGSGSYEIFLDNVYATLHIFGASDTRSGVDYLKIKKLLATFLPEHIKFNFQNLLGGNQMLGNYANKFMNRFAMDIYKEVRSSMEVTVASVFKDVAQRFYNKVPYHQIYL